MLQLLDTVTWQGEPIPGDRLAALLTVLAQAAPRSVLVDELADQVWIDQRPEHPEKALQVLVSRLRARTVPEIVERTSGGYRLGLAPADVDVLALRSQAAEATAAHAAGDFDVARLAARDVLAIRVGAAGTDLVGEALRAQAKARRILGSVLLARGEHTEALSLLESALAESPDDEELVAEVIRAEAEVRGVPSALARYAAYAERVREAVGADPGSVLTRLHTELLARDAPVRAGLRYDATALIGRDDDIAALRTELHTHRVVSIVGPGGLGKTRMAHLLGRLASEPVVHFVELVGVRAPEGVLNQVASALGVADAPSSRVTTVRARPTTDLRARVIGQLGAPTLLILDNCEHVVEAVADLVAFLVTTLDTVRVLTTTRAPLGIAAEWVYLLPQLSDDEAVELFEERARSARSSVQLERGEVETLVTRLDGLPLAIELAAAKTRVMSVAEITRRLEDRFALLVAGDRSAPDRHRTLEAVISWSWNLLGAADQEGLQMLSALPDGFALDAAEALLGPGAIGVLAELVDQSLLVVQESDAGVRYRFLETVREFGLKQLAASGRESQVRASIRQWAVDYARHQVEHIFGPDQVAVVDEIRLEARNLIAELRAALEDADAGSVVPLMALLSAYWAIRGDHFAMLAFTHRLLRVACAAPLPHEEDRPLWRAVVAMTATMLLIFGSGRDPEALALLERLGYAGDGRVPDAMSRVARSVLVHDDPREELSDLGDNGNRSEQWVALTLLSHIRENVGDVRGALAASRRALSLAQDLGQWAAAQLQAQLCSLCAADEDIEEAAMYAAQALPLVQAVRAEGDSIQLRTTQIYADIVAGRIEAAESTYAEIARIAEGGRIESDIDARLGVLMCGAELALAQGDVAAGLACYREAVEEAARVEHQFRTKVASVGLPGVGGEASPWMTHALAVVVFAHAYYDELDVARDHAMELMANPLSISRVMTRVDYPVMGAVLVATGAWMLTEGETRSAALRRIAMGRVFGYPRFQPVFWWSRVWEVVERYEGGDELAALIEEYQRLGFQERLELARTL